MEMFSKDRFHLLQYLESHPVVILDNLSPLLTKLFWNLTMQRRRKLEEIRYESGVVCQTLTSCAP